MIISLRGTSGCGKTHLVRNIVRLYSQHRAIMVPRRKRALYEIHGRNPGGRALVTPGHYEIANGGIDTLPDLPSAYGIALWAAMQHHDVLMEGKNMSDGLAHVTGLLARGFDARLVFIDEPLDVCIASVHARGHNIAEDSIIRTQKKVRNSMSKFPGKTFTGNRAQCLATVQEWLGW